MALTTAVRWISLAGGEPRRRKRARRQRADPTACDEEVVEYLTSLLRLRKPLEQLKDEYQRSVLKAKVKPVLNAIEKVTGFDLRTLEDMMVSKGRAERKRNAAERALKAEGVAEFRKALEAAARERVVLERWGADVSLAVMEALSRCASSETRTEADARGKNKRKYFPKRHVAKTWLLVEGACGEPYEQAVGISVEAHRELPRGTPEERAAAAPFDDRKLTLYLTMILRRIAAHCEEAEAAKETAAAANEAEAVGSGDVERQPVTLARLVASSAALAEARELDPTCGAEEAFAVNFTRVANELRVASGARNELHTGDGGQVLTDILARMGIPAGLFVPMRRPRNGTRAQRRGARTFVMADGRKERAPRAVTRKAAKAELAKLEESKEVDVGRVFPPRVCTEVEHADGSTTLEAVGASGRVLNLRARITRRLSDMVGKWQVAWRPAFEEMSEEEVAAQLAAHRLAPQCEEEGREETLESARGRLRTAWLWAMSDRSKTAQEGGKCSAGCDECEPRVCCSACGQSRAVYACACAQPSVVRCGRCARMGRRTPADVHSALCHVLGHVGPSAAPQHTDGRRKELEHLVKLERMHEVTELLSSLGEPTWREGEGRPPHWPEGDNEQADQVREARLLKAQMGVGIRIALWADGSPMLNKPWQLCTWHLLYDTFLFARGLQVERECRRPEIIFIQQDGDDLEALIYQNGVRLEELHALNEPLQLPGGLRTHATVRYVEGDNPELQRLGGVCSGGGAECSCCRCKAKRSEHTQLVTSVRAELRSLPEAVALAERAAQAGEAYQLRFGPSYGTAAELAQLAYVIGVEGGVGRLRKENEAKVRARCCGYTSAPALLGANLRALEEVHALGSVEMVPDYSLHGLKGILGHLYETVDTMLTPEERTALEKNLDRLHNGGATVKSGVHRRLELANTPDLLGAFELGELREAMDALAQAMVWGIRVTHARWHARYHFCVLRTAVLMHKFGVLLARCVPATKVSEGHV